MNTLELLFLTMRPSRWWRTGIIFLPLLFSGDIFNFIFILKLLVSCVIFILLTGSINIIDDIIDVQEDKKDPVKRTGPIASGEISVNRAEFAAGMFLVGAFVSAFFLGSAFGLISIAYFAVLLSYFLVLKKIFVMDALTISVEAVICVIAGTIAIERPVSSWLIVFVLIASVLLVFCERKRAMLISQYKGKDQPEAPVKNGIYDEKLLDQLINATAPFVLSVYTLYTIISADGVKYNMVYTVPIVMFAVYRIFYLTYNIKSDAPLEKRLIKDLPVWLSVGGWIILTAVLTSVF